MAVNLAEVEEKIGYTFKNPMLLVRAFTHNSYANQKCKSYQNLEFLGDSILDFVIAKIFFYRYPDKNEGYLTRIRASVVSEKPLAEAIDRLNVSHNLLVGVGEKKQNVADLDSVKADLFESIVGAIYVDSEDVSECEKFIVRLLSDIIDGVDSARKSIDAKSELNEYGTKHNKSVAYREIFRSGPDHSPIFKYEVLIDGEKFGVGEGKSIKEAEQIAAQSALNEIRNKNNKV
ncbi:MAG: ribonuclease III [Christensenellales bacterium]